MKQLFLSFVLLVLMASSATAQENPSPDHADIVPPIMESHSYTYVVDEDGTAKVFVRLDGIKPETKEKTYQYNLPDNTVGEPLVWYRENGCLEYRADNCVYYGTTTWKEVKFVRNEQKLTITIPASRYPGRFNENNLNLGVVFSTNDLTQKFWWGRNVDIETGSTEQFVPYLSIGVYMPDGVYVRDNTQGPSGWGAGVAESLSNTKLRPIDVGDPRLSHVAMLDSAGTGQIYRYRHNLMPREHYSFDFMSSTSLWKLFYREIGFAFGWLVAISVVVAALLRLLIGKKPLSWYVSLVGLLMLIGVLLVGLWFTYQMAFGRSDQTVM